MGLVRTALDRLSNDFTNIDELYQDLKSNWLESNINKTEVDFISSFDFSNGYDKDSIEEDNFTEYELENLKKLSTYLGKKTSTVEWTNQDYLTRYKKDKIFGFQFFKTYRSEDFNIVIEKLNQHKVLYDFIFEKLTPIERIEFKNDFCDQLCRLRDKQISKFKDIFNDLINLIEEEYLENKSDYNIFQKTQNTVTKNHQKKATDLKQKKIPEKWHALLYFIELKAKNLPVPQNRDGQFDKAKLEAIGQERLGSSGQSFYRRFIEIDENILSKSYGEDWKEKIIQLSNNDDFILNYLQTKHHL